MNTWIFQGNPNRFKVDEYLRENENITWSIRQEHYANDVRVGDVVYIWRSEAGKLGYGGVVARATVTDLPVQRTDATSDYWVTPSDANEVLPRVDLIVEELALDGNHIKREYLKNAETLSDLLILKMSNNTNYKLTSTQADELLKLWGNIKFSHHSGNNGIPVPEPVSRKREYLLYSEQQRSQVVYEYLFNGNTHRWIDENTLALDSEDSRGYQAMGILHYLGLKKPYKGLFKGLTIEEAIQLLEQESLENDDEVLFAPIISALGGISRNKIDRNIVEESIHVHSEEGKEYPEGRVAYVLHKKRERNPKIIKEAKQLFINRHGHLFCEACNFDFKSVYGDRGDDFIEGHHKKLVSEMKEGEKTKIEDIAMLCSNCHRMIHRKPMITVEKLAESIKGNRGYSK